MVLDDTLVRLSPESIILLGERGEVLVWNDAAERLYGWSSGEMVGEVMADRVRCIEGIPLPAIQQGPAGERHVVRRLARNGTLRTVDVLRLPYGLPGSGPLGVVEFGKDVTGLFEAQRLLESANVRFESLFNAMPASFWELDFSRVREILSEWTTRGITDLGAHLSADPAATRVLLAATRIVDFNEKSVDLFGRGDRDEMYADLNAFWPDESLHVYAASLLAASTRQLAYSAECVFTSLTGRRFEAIFTVSMPPPQLERAQLLIGIVDISTMRRALTEVEASERRYRELFDATPAANIEVDCSALDRRLHALRDAGVVDLPAYLDDKPCFIDDALASCRVVSVNGRFVSLMRAGTPDEAIGGLGRYWSRSPHIFRRFVEARFAGKERHEAQALLTRADGTPLHCLFAAAFGPLQSRPHIMLATLVDVSDRVRAEEALARTRAELAHAGRVAVLGELAASIAHEVSQPLSTIALNSFTALHSLSHPDPDVEELRTLATRSSEEAVRATEILARIRGMVRRGEPSRTPVNANRVVADALSFVRDELLRHCVEAHLALSAGLPALSGDEVQLQQVVVNLVMNAAQAMATSSGTPRKVRVSTMLQDGSVAIAVDDTGPGISMQDRARLFDSFFTTKEYGMGIGLPICLSIVDAHGGVMRPEDGPPGWTTRFIVLLPPADG